jgi:hypothetical protein
VTVGAGAQGRGIGGISHRAAALVAWSVSGLSFVLTTLSLLLLALNLQSPGVHIFTYWAEDTVAALAFSTIGAIIVSHRPEHPIGWLFCVMGLLASIDHFCGEYAIYALLAHPGTLPAGAEGGVGKVLGLGFVHRHWHVLGVALP